MKLSKTVDIGAKIPRGYGLAHRDLGITFRMVCYPIPLNVIVSLVLSVWHLLRRGITPSWWERILHEHRTEGYERGCKCAVEDAYARGYNAALITVRKRMEY